MKEQIPANHPAATVTHKHFGLTEDQIKQATITYDGNGFSINFGEKGLTNTPELTNQLLKFVGIFTEP
jgi:hypothetical protein